MSKQNQILGNLHDNLVAAVNGVVIAIKEQNTLLERLLHIMALDATKLANLFSLLTQLLATLPSDAATIADLQGQIATLKANDAALDALAPQLDTLTAGVTAAQPPPNITPVPTPEPVPAPAV